MFDRVGGLDDGRVRRRGGGFRGGDAWDRLRWRRGQLDGRRGGRRRGVDVDRPGHGPGLTHVGFDVVQDAAGALLGGGAAQDIAAGGAAEQAAALQALLASKDGKAIAARPAAAPAVVPAPAPAKVEPKKSFLGILAQPFAKTKWYTWAIAGGVTALVVGLMVAGRYGKDSVTLDATYTPPAQN